MATLQGAIDEIIDELADVEGIQRAPDDPEQQIVVWPVAMAYASESVSVLDASNTKKDLHDITIAVLMPLVSLPHAVQITLPMFDRITEVLWDHLQGQTSAHYSQFRDISGSFGPIEWGNNEVYFGWLIKVNQLKIRQTF